eukprot:scaffold4998_cov120-Isochrysis_galbana.AAC.4
MGEALSPPTPAPTAMGRSGPGAPCERRRRICNRKTRLVRAWGNGCARGAAGQAPCSQSSSLEIRGWLALGGLIGLLRTSGCNPNGWVSLVLAIGRDWEAHAPHNRQQIATESCRGAMGVWAGVAKVGGWRKHGRHRDRPGRPAAKGATAQAPRACPGAMPTGCQDPRAARRRNASQRRHGARTAFTSAQGRHLAHPRDDAEGR